MLGIHRHGATITGNRRSRDQSLQENAEMRFADQPEINPYAAPKTRPASFMGVEGQPFVGYAGFWRRVGAYLIDAILVQIFTLIAAFAAGMLIGIVGAATGNPDMVQKMARPLVLLVVLI